MRRAWRRLVALATVGLLLSACGMLPTATGPERLARDLLACGEHALDEGRYELAASCLEMASNLTRDEKTTARLVRLESRRQREQAAAMAPAESRRAAEAAASLAKKAEQVEQLKVRYQQVYEAGWWQAARDTLAQLRSRVPRDPQVLAWTADLRLVLDRHVAAEIERGQALYSRGQLREALAVWREAATLAPDNTVLQDHITRVERFITKLERLEKDDDA